MQTKNTDFTGILGEKESAILSYSSIGSNNWVFTASRNKSNLSVQLSVEWKKYDGSFEEDRIILFKDEWQKIGEVMGWL